jgi:hypothetical protein
MKRRHNKIKIYLYLLENSNWNMILRCCKFYASHLFGLKNRGKKGVCENNRVSYE